MFYVDGCKYGEIIKTMGDYFLCRDMSDLVDYGNPAFDLVKEDVPMRLVSYKDSLGWAIFDKESDAHSLFLSNNGCVSEEEEVQDPDLSEFIIDKERPDNVQDM